MPASKKRSYARYTIAAVELLGTLVRLEHVNVSTSIGTPRAIMREQLGWFAREVMPRFSR